MREYPQAIAHYADLIQHYLEQIRDSATELLEHPCPSYTHFRDSVLTLSVITDKLYALVAPAAPTDPAALEGPQLEEEPHPHTAATDPAAPTPAMDVTRS